VIGLWIAVKIKITAVYRPLDLLSIPMDSEQDGCHGTHAAIFV